MKITHKHKQTFLGLASVFSGIAIFLSQSAPVLAAGSAKYVLSASSTSVAKDASFTLTVQEDSGSATANGAQVNLTYDTAKLTVTATDGTGNPFPTCFPTTISVANGLIAQGCAKLGAGGVTGPQTLMKITFRALVDTGTTVVKISATGTGSNNTDITSPSSDGSTTGHIWDGALTSTTITLKAVPATGGGGGGTGGTGGGTGGTGGGTGGTSGGSGGTATKKTASNTTSTNSTGSTSTNPSTTTPITVTPTPGYPVSIVIKDSQDRVVAGASVSLDGTKVTSDLNGVASFINVTAGKHKLKITSSEGTVTKDISVTAGVATSVQQFPISLKKSSNSKLVIYAAIGGGILVLGAIVLAVMRQQALKRMYGSYSSSNESAVVGGASSSVAPAPSASSVEATPAIVKPGQAESEIIKPNDNGEAAK